MSNSTWDDIPETENVLAKKKQTSPTPSTIKRGAGRPRVKEKRTNRVVGYLSAEEHEEFMRFCDDRPAAAMVRKIVLERIREK